MKQRKLQIVALMLVVVITVDIWLAGLALRSDSLADQVGIWPTATPFSETQISENSVAVLAAQLEAAGLTPDSYLDATGIETHLARLAAGEVSVEALEQYATDLRYLNEVTAEYGRQVPTSFWDVRTEQMIEGNVTSTT